MKFVIHPAVDADRLRGPESGGARGRVGQRGDRRTQALAAMPGADAFLGKITPELLARATGSGGSSRSRPASNITCSPNSSPTRAS